MKILLLFACFAPANAIFGAPAPKRAPYAVMSQRVGILALALLFLFPVKSHSADEEILFLDLNNSPKEVEAARAAAKKSGRSLVVVPELDSDRRKMLSAVEGKIAGLNKQYKKLCSKEMRDPECIRIDKDRKALKEEQSEILDSVFFDQAKLEQFLSSRGGKPFSSLIISGHDGTGSFSGVFGQLGDEEIAKALNRYPEIKNSLRSLHLWGCYTTSLGSLFLNWKKYFPNVALITGYEGRAPLNDKPAGWHYLQGVLSREPELLQATDSQKLQKLLRKIPGALQVSSGIYSCENYASPKEHYSFLDLQNRCEDLKPLIQEQAPEYECFLKAKQDRCANPPENVGAGPVRAFYELLHKSSACAEFRDEPLFRTYSRDTAIRLVFAKEIQKNFGHIYSSQLREIDDFLAELGAPADLRFHDVANLSRKEILARADRLLEFLRQQTTDPWADPKEVGVGPRQAKIASLAQFQEGLTRLMAKLGERCVPFGWTEPDQNEESWCMKKKDLGLAGMKRLLNNTSDLRQKTLLAMEEELWRKFSEEEDSAKSPANHAARKTVVEAQALKLKLFMEEDSPSEETIHRADQLRQWAETVLELTRKGDTNAKQNPRAANIALDQNIHSFRQAVARNKQLMNRKQNDSSGWGKRAGADYKQEAELYQAALDATLLLANSASPEERGPERQRAKEEAIARLAKQIHDRDLAAATAAFKLAETNLQDSQEEREEEKVIQAQQQKKTAAEQKLMRLQKQSPQERIQAAEDFLFNFHFFENGKKQDMEPPQRREEPSQDDFGEFEWGSSG